MTCMCFFFNDTATTEIYTLSLHDALPISEGAVARDLIPVERDVPARAVERRQGEAQGVGAVLPHQVRGVHHVALRSEEHTSELQSRQYLVCRLLLEKKKQPCKHPTRLPTR